MELKYLVSAYLYYYGLNINKRFSASPKHVGIVNKAYKEKTGEELKGAFKFDRSEDDVKNFYEKMVEHGIIDAEKYEEFKKAVMEAEPVFDIKKDSKKQIEEKEDTESIETESAEEVQENIEVHNEEKQDSSVSRIKRRPISDTLVLQEMREQQKKEFMDWRRINESKKKVMEQNEPKQTPQQPTVQQPVFSFDWKWILIGGVAVLGIFGLMLFFRSRDKSISAKEIAEEKSISTNSQTAYIPPVQYNPTPDVIDWKQLRGGR